MSAAPDVTNSLLANIDKPDFSDALAADTDGTFVADVNTYLEAWQAKIKSYQDAGLSRDEFNALNRLSNSIQAAGRVIEFFVKVQKLPPTQ